MAVPDRSFDELPAEVKELVVQACDSNQDLKSLRQVNSLWKLPAERKLFKNIKLCADEESILHFHQLAGSENVSQFVRHVTIETMPNLDMHGRVEEAHSLSSNNFHGFNSSLQEAAALLGFQFCKLNSVNLKFSADNMGHDDDVHDWGGTVFQSHMIRQGFLIELYSALARRHESTTYIPSPLQPVSSFTCTNLLKFTSDHVEDTELANLFFAGVKELNFSVRVKRTERVKIGALIASQKELRRSWLEPTAVAGRLTSLCIYMDTYWGAVPYFDLKDLNLPHLRRLSLGNYCFAYPAQIAWLTSLKSLEFLSLDDCPIVFLMESKTNLRESELVMCGSGWNLRTYDSDSTRFYVNNTRWYDYFALMARDLTNLTELRCGHGKWDAPEGGGDYFRQAFENRDKLGSVVHSTRYVVFNGRAHNDLHSTWLEVDRDFPNSDELSQAAQIRLQYKIPDESRRPKLSKENRAKDEQALSKLLQVLSSRRMQRR